MRNTFTGVVLALVLAGCLHAEVPRADDKINNHFVAIELARKACSEICLNQERRDEGAWDTIFHDGIWDVRFYAKGDRPSCPLFRIRIFSSNGYSDTGMYCVSTD